MPLRQIRLVLEYDGSGFDGWQVGSFARGGRPGRSVQAALEAAVRAITGQASRVVAAGRTDAGVSAEGQVACFFTDSQIPAESFAPALNSELPPDVSVLRSDEVPLGFHVRKDVVSKLYRYTILNRPARPAIGRAQMAHVMFPLDEEKMRQAAQALVGTHDFTSFAAREATKVKNPVRTITRIDVRREGERVVTEVEGRSFLMHMVRTIVGSLIEVGRGKEEPSWIAQVLEARDRRLAGPTAPPEGLTLVRVVYGDAFQRLP